MCRNVYTDRLDVTPPCTSDEVVEERDRAMTVDGEAAAERDALEDEQPRAAVSRNVWTDLLALVVIVLAPTIFILVGHADAAAIVAASEFVVAVLLVWRGKSPK
jgi:hypothetical protein